MAKCVFCAETVNMKNKRFTFKKSIKLTFEINKRVSYENLNKL